MSPAQLRALRRVAAAPRTPPALARRARIVLAAAGHPTGDDAPAGRTTVDRWVRRYAEAGLAGLADRPRSGRPPVTDPTTHPLIVAPLLAPAVGWTSRTIAELTGHSQSAVARAWAKAYATSATDLGDRLPAAGLRLVAAAVDAGNSLLVLTADGPADGFTAGGSFMRSVRRPPLQALLAADRLTADRVAADRVAADRVAAGRVAAGRVAAGRRPPGRSGGADAALVGAVRRRVGAGASVYVVTRRPVPAGGADVGGDGGAAGAGQVVVEDPAAWQGLLAELVRRCTRSPAPELVAAQQSVMRWARGGRGRFEWTAHGPERRPVAPGVAVPRATSQAIADDVLAVVLELLASGRLAGGDRVTESLLARAVHTSRGHVRDALRTLASRGLIELEPHRGAVIPAPHTADVVETYAARRALGGLVVRRAAHAAPGRLAPVDRALEHLVRTGRTGDAWATGEADLRFQDALARSTGMRRIPHLFIDLTAQIRLFTAVMGLNYLYSIPAMCRDDTALMERIRARDEAGAARVWHRKMDDATAYMTTQLAGMDATPRPLPLPS